MMDKRYIEYFTPLIQNFVREVEELPHPDIKKMPEPFFPLFGKNYETSSLKLPQLVVYGAYDAARRTGPAVWLKCVVAGTIKLGWNKDVVPILYLPNVSRQTLRAAADCPPLLQPLVELQYRGVVWTQRNGKDWTVEAFLTSDDGLGLDVSRDEATRNSLHSSLSVLLETPVPQLEGKRLEAEDFDKLMVGDHPRDLLEWMNDPKLARAGWGEGKWHAFRSRCKNDYGFDPDADGAVGAAERLGFRQGEGLG